MDRRGPRRLWIADKTSEIVEEWTENGLKSWKLIVESTYQ